VLISCTSRHGALSAHLKCAPEPLALRHKCEGHNPVPLLVRARRGSSVAAFLLASIMRLTDPGQSNVHLSIHDHRGLNESHEGLEYILHERVYEPVIDRLLTLSTANGSLLLPMVLSVASACSHK
jgi:hypothetical protein